MPQKAWSAKRERQYEHIKDGLREQGRSESVAEEIAARTVNKERARGGETRTASRSSVKDISSGRRGGLPIASGRGRADLRTALQRGTRARHRGPLEDEQARTGAGARTMSADAASGRRSVLVDGVDRLRCGAALHVETIGVGRLQTRPGGPVAA